MIEVSVRSPMTQIETHTMAAKAYPEIAFHELVVGPVALTIGRGGGMNGADTLRAAARALSNRTDLAHAPALAGLLHNRAEDMERNIALWRHAQQDIPALVDSHYGAYLTVAKTVLLHRRYGRAYATPRRDEPA
jgi:hypothetical protein